MEYEPEPYLTAQEVMQRYRISDVSLWRWLANPDMDFPRPSYYGRRRMFRIAELDAFDKTRPRTTPPCVRVGVARRSATLLNNQTGTES